MKRIYLILLALSFSAFSTISGREMGEFVRDLQFKPLEFEVPKITSVEQSSGVEVFSLKKCRVSYSVCGHLCLPWEKTFEESFCRDY